jgi:hypothetical protein
MIDLSSPVAIYGAGFGAARDEVSRYQTFVARAFANAYAVAVKIRKMTMGGQSDVTLDLFATADGHPTGAPLASGIIPASSADTVFREFVVPLDYRGLVDGATYAVVLGQVTPQTDHYEWNSYPVDPTAVLGKYDGAIWTAEPSLGDGWTRVFVSPTVIDFSNTVSSAGYGFGALTDEVTRYQTFFPFGYRELSAVGVEIRKIAPGAQSDVTVDLFATADGHPTGPSLARATIPASTIGTAFAESVVPLRYSGLTDGVTYAIVLGQVTPQADHYEWNSYPVDPSAVFGKSSNGSWTAEPGLGDGWMRLFVSR